jgi:hypothetical protein
MKKREKRTEKIIKKYGYEYHLVESIREDAQQPAAFGMKGYALKSVKKII